MKATKKRTQYTAISSLLALLYFSTPAFGALINSWEFRGGNCQPPTGGGDLCMNAQATLEGSTVHITKTYFRSEEPTESEEPNQGNGGPGTHGGGSDEETHEELFSRLPPINMFLTLENSGESNNFTFQETVINDTSLSWDGFLHRLRRNESGLAAFLSNPLTSDTFATSEVAGEHGVGPLVNLTWTNGKLAPGSQATFTYAVGFADCVVGLSCSDQLAGKDGVDGYIVNLQQFPLIAAVPEPGTLMLFGMGLFGLTLFKRKASQS